MTRAWLLKILLRVIGLASILALGGVVMPIEWMAATHAWLGLGEMPRGPVVEYLARSLTAFYALFGVLALALATDVERYRGAIRVVGVSACALGIAMLGIDLSAGMPFSWTASEGPLTAAAGAALVWFARDEP